jgi:hypothetical protein
MGELEEGGFGTSTSLLQVLLLVGLALNAQMCLGNSLEPFWINGLSTIATLSIGFILNPSQGIVDVQQHPAFLRGQ